MIKRHQFAFKHILKSAHNLTETQTVFSRSISSYRHCKSLTLNCEHKTDGDSVNKPMFKSARYGFGDIFRSSYISPFQNLTFNSDVARSKHLFCQQCRSMSTPPRETVMNVFDRKAKRIQRNRAALRKDHAVYDYIKDEVCCHFNFCCYQESVLRLTNDNYTVYTELNCDLNGEVLSRVNTLYRWQSG